ncbi:MAG: CapA family protein [Eubacterium sp.]|nr:CapA family protein [Eubacterium sp.]
MKENLRISILGDVCPDRSFNRFFRNTNEIVFNNVSEYINDSDITIANLEAPASDKGNPIEKTGPRLHCKSDDLDALKQIGIDVISLANNHILDYGEEALSDTINKASSIGLSVFGAGKNLEEAAKPLFVEKSGWKIGFLSYAEEEFSIAGKQSFGANLFDPYISLDQIKDAKEECDYLIVLYHGGIEHYELPSPLLQKKCRKIAEYGANLILCQHSHCIGTLEKYQDSEILYGQGNSFFGKIEGNNRWNQGFLVDVVLTETDKKLEFKLIKAENNGIAFANREDSDKRLEEMLTLSEKIYDEVFIIDSWNDYCKTQEAMDLALVYGWGRTLNKINRIFNNKIANFLLSKRKRMITMNLIRCDAHREVVKTILENTYE